MHLETFNSNNDVKLYIHVVKKVISVFALLWASVLLYCTTTIYC